MSEAVLGQLAATIKARRTDSAATSYTRQLLDGGPQRCARKLGEEAIETVIAGISQDDAALKAEAADLIYHLLVLLESRNIGIDEVLKVLEGRSGVSGLDEKASRSASAKGD
ncbi:MAG: phosphoribosyl-ATP diphosphatase [Hyphomicrobiaceae bacterium]